MRGRSVAPFLGAALALALLVFAPAAPADAQDAPAPPVTGEVFLAEGSGSIETRLFLRYRDPGAVPPELRRRAIEEGGEEAVAPLEGGALELRFFTSDLDSVVPLLREARQAADALPVTVRIPAELRSADVWTFQARLSQAGIRQVRIVTDPPSVSLRAG